jgi:hypothetical protein
MKEDIFTECLFSNERVNENLDKIIKEAVVSELQAVRQSFYDGVRAINEKYGNTLSCVTIGYAKPVGIIFNIDIDDLK